MKTDPGDECSRRSETFNDET